MRNILRQFSATKMAHGICLLPPVTAAGVGIQFPGMKRLVDAQDAFALRQKLFLVLKLK